MPMDERLHDAPETDTTANEAARITALIRDGWWLLFMVVLLLLLLRTV